VLQSQQKESSLPGLTYPVPKHNQNIKIKNVEKTEKSSPAGGTFFHF
jgi:hypothetical protein